MKTHIQTLILLLCYSTLLDSCSQPSRPRATFKSLEVINGDTVNRTDEMGKQGRWVHTKENKLKDTVYYRNDTIITKD